MTQVTMIRNCLIYSRSVCRFVEDSKDLNFFPSNFENVEFIECNCLHVLATNNYGKR